MTGKSAGAKVWTVGGNSSHPEVRQSVLDGTEMLYRTLRNCVRNKSCPIAELAWQQGLTRMTVMKYAGSFDSPPPIDETARTHDTPSATVRPKHEIQSQE